MIKYIVGLIIIIVLYNRIKVYNIKKKKKNCKIIPGAEPFFYKRGKKGILLLHGWSSTPHDIISLGKYLAKRNITVLAPLFKGHGTCVEDMSLTKKEDWIKDAENALLKLKKTCKRVYLSGVCLSGNICTILAAKYKVDGIIFQGASFIFRKQKWVNIAAVFLPFIKYIKFFQKKGYHRHIPKKLMKKRITYDSASLNSCQEGLKIIKESKKVLHKVTCPALIMQTTTDIQISNDSPQYIYDHISSKKKKIFWMPASYHIFIVDDKKTIAFKEIYKFIKEN